MPFHMTSEPQFFLVVFFDPLTPPDLQAAADAITATEARLPQTPHRLTDLRQVSEMDLTYPDMAAFVERRKEQRLANPIKSAIVASRPVQIGFARMFQILSTHPQIKVQVFDTLEKAEVWLTGV
jgi:hypothetical protein